MPDGGRGHEQSNGRCRTKALFLIEDSLGHRTHLRFLRSYVAADARFEPTLIPLTPNIPRWLGTVLAQLQRPILHRYGADFSVWWTFQYKRLQARRALQALDLSKFDLVYVHTHTAAAAILDLPPTMPTVVSLDLTWKLVFGGESRYTETPLFAPIYNMEQRIFERADLIVAFSEWAAASVSRDYGISPDKVAVVRNGVALPNGTAPRVTNGKLHVGFVGNEMTRKGGDLLLRVHQEHFADQAHLTLVTSDVVPPKPLRNVTVHKKVPWDELMTNVMPNFDVFAFPTRFDYSPWVVIEAMSCGVPVIASRVGAIPEMVEDGVSGFLIKAEAEELLAERLAWAIDHHDRLPPMGAEARSQAAAGYAATQNYPFLLDLLHSRSRH